MLYKAIATLAFLLIVAGWTQRRTRSRHVPLVASGMLLDLVLVLILEFSRDVIGMTMAQSWLWTQWTHIGTSTLAVLLYVPVVWYGIALLRGRAGVSARVAHRRFATAALCFRSVGFAFMWFV